MIRRLVQRAGNPAIYESRADCVDAMLGLTKAAFYFPPKDLASLQQISVAFIKLGKRDPGMLEQVVKGQRLDPQNVQAGRAASLWTLCFPKIDCEEEVWREVVTAVEEGLQEGKWHPMDVRTILQQVAYWEVIPPNLPTAVEKYVLARVNNAGPGEVAVLATILTILPATRTSSIFHTVATRAAEVGESLTPSAMGTLCLALAKVGIPNVDLFIALQEHSVRFAEECETGAAVYFFTYSMLNDTQYLDMDGIKCMTEKICLAEKPLTHDQLGWMIKALWHMKKDLRESLAEEIKQLVQYVSNEVSLVFTEKPATPSSSTQPAKKKELSLQEGENYIQRYVPLLRRTFGEHGELPEEGIATVNTIADFVEKHAEAIVSADTPPFNLIGTIFYAGTERSRAVALNLLTEASQQGLLITPVDSFRFLLQLADHNLWEKQALRHLRRQFSIGVTNIPLIQLCAALRCFEIAQKEFLTDVDVESLTAEEEVEVEEELEDVQRLLEQVDEITSKAMSSGGIDIKCTLSIARSAGLMECKRVPFMERIVTYLSTKVDSASPEIHSAETAFLALKALEPYLGEDVEGVADTEGSKVRAFLNEVLEKGEKDPEGENTTQWMNRNDPANFITPLTEEQEQGWEILKKLNATRSDNTDALEVLCNEYLALLDKHRVDDLKYYFNMFAEKVYKNDKAMKAALDQILETGIITKLAGSTISDMLVSFTQIRFAYYGSIKKFLLAVSEEQWAQLDASTVATIVQSMGKLGVRMPSVLVHLGERLSVVYKLLSPMDTAVLLAGLQALGYDDAAVMSLLMDHVSKNAKRFDETALAVLWSAPHVHRLLNNESSSVPLLTQTCQVQLSPKLQQKIVASVKKSALPREVINDHVLRLAPLSEASSEALRLEQQSRTQDILGIEH